MDDVRESYDHQYDVPTQLEVIPRLRRNRHAMRAEDVDHDGSPLRPTSRHERVRSGSSLCFEVLDLEWKDVRRNLRVPTTNSSREHASLHVRRRGAKQLPDVAEPF